VPAVTAPPPRRWALRPTGKLSQDDARRHHRSLLLQQLFTAGPASRADLARATGLTRVTVSDLVGELLGETLVEELGTPVGSRVGKPPTLVGLVPDATHVLALDLSGEGVFDGAVVNLDGRVLHRARRDRGGTTGADAVALVLDLVADLRRFADRPVLGLGVGSPGVVADDGTVLGAPNLGWTGLPLAAELGAATGLRVHVANDANAAVLAEHTYGTAHDGDRTAGPDAERGLMLLRLGTGVGAGLVLEGALVRGQRYAAGEIGHVVLDPDGERCACGRNGCLETVVAVPRLRALAANDAANDAADDAADLRLAAAGVRLGAALAPVVGALDLRELVLSGPVELLEGPLRRATEETIRARTLHGDDLLVRTSTLGDDVVLVGAAALVLAGELGVA